MSQSTYVDKISKLLRKAESTNSQHEAEALFEKAQQLMTKYAIDESMLKLKKGLKREEIIRKVYPFRGIYRQPLFELGHRVGLANDCKVMVYDRTYSPQERQCILIGFENDVNNAMLLIASLEIQALSSMKRWWETKRDLYVDDRHYAKKARKEFIYGFASEISRRLQNARREAVKEAKAEHDTGDEGSSVAIMLADKKTQIQKWMEDEYGNLRSSGVGRRSSSGSYEAHQAGREAGSRADIGNKRVKGNKGQLGG